MFGSSVQVRQGARCIEEDYTTFCERWVVVFGFEISSMECNTVLLGSHREVRVTEMGVMFTANHVNELARWIGRIKSPSRNREFKYTKQNTH